MSGLSPAHFVTVCYGIAPDFTRCAFQFSTSKAQKEVGGGGGGMSRTSRCFLCGRSSVISSLRRDMNLACLHTVVVAFATNYGNTRWLPSRSARLLSSSRPCCVRPDGTRLPVRWLPGGPRRCWLPAKDRRPELARFVLHDPMLCGNCCSGMWVQTDTIYWMSPICCSSLALSLRLADVC